MSSRASITGALAEWMAALSLPIMGGALLGISIVCFLAQPIWGDPSIYLYIADRLLDGASLDLREFVDPNPPLIIWISEIPVALARVLGISPQIAMELCLAALLALVIAWCGTLTRRADRDESRAFVWWLASVILYAAAIYPWRHYAQREHLLILMVLPYLFMAASRLRGSVPGVLEAAAAGLLAGIGFSLKPFNLLVVVGVEALLLHRLRRPRSLARPEIIALLFGGLAYCAAVLIWAPDYLAKIAPMVQATWFDYGRVPLREMVAPTRLLKIVGLIMIWAIVRRRLRHEPLVSVLLITAVAATVAYLAQQKKLEYHFLPAMVPFNIVVGVVLIDLFLSWAARRQSPSRPGFSLGAALLTSLVVAIFYYPVQSAKAATNWVNDRVTAQLEITAALPRGTTILILSPSTGVVFDMLLNRGLLWGSRFPCLWMLASIFRGEFMHDAEGASARERTAPIAQWTRAAVAEDLQRRHPSIVLVERCDDLSIEPCGSLEAFRVNVLQWFGRDPAFAAAWSNYSLRWPIGPYDLWCANESGDVCERTLADLPSSGRAMASNMAAEDHER